MAIVVRTNGAANNALAGLERGLGTGIGFGLEASRQRKAQEEAAARTQLAREQAMRIDQEIQRENSERSAGQEAAAQSAGEYGGDMSGALNAGMKLVPGAAAAVGGATQDKWGRIQEIVKRMDPAAAREFIKDAREREIENTMETERGRLRDDIARWTAEGGGRSNPEDSPWLDPQEVADGDAEFQMGVDRLTALAAHPKSDPLQIRAMWGELRANKIKAHGKAQARMKSYQEMFNRAETDPLAPARTPQQQEQIDTLLQTYKESPELYDSKAAQMQFKERFNDALEGYTRIGNDRIKIEDAELFMHQKVENEKLRAQVLRAQAEANKALAEQRSEPEPTGLKPKDLLEAATKYEALANEMGLSPAEKKRLLGISEQYRKAAEGNAPIPVAAPDGVSDAQIEGPAASGFKDIPDADLRAKGVEMGRAIKDPTKKIEFAKALLAEMKRRGIQ